MRRIGYIAIVIAVLLVAALFLTIGLLNRPAVYTPILTNRARTTPRVAALFLANPIFLQ